MKWISMVILPISVIGAMGGLLGCGCEGEKRGLHGTCNGFMCVGGEKFSTCDMGEGKFACNEVHYCPTGFNIPHCEYDC